MLQLALHHVSLISTDLERSMRFYEDILSLKRIPRPPFASAGVWCGLGALQVHVILNREGTFGDRRCADSVDVHFALRTDDFDATVATLERHGYRDDLPEGDLKRLVVRRDGQAGFPQLFMLDPDQQVIEINQAR